MKELLDEYGMFLIASLVGIAVVAAILFILSDDGGIIKVMSDFFSGMGMVVTKG